MKALILIILLLQGVDIPISEEDGKYIKYITTYTLSSESKEDINYGDIINPEKLSGRTDITILSKCRASKELKLYLDSLGREIEVGRGEKATVDTSKYNILMVSERFNGKKDTLALSNSFCYYNGFYFKYSKRYYESKIFNLIKYFIPYEEAYINYYFECMRNG